MAAKKSDFIYAKKSQPPPLPPQEMEEENVFVQPPPPPPLFPDGEAESDFDFDSDFDLSTSATSTSTQVEGGEEGMDCSFPEAEWLQDGYSSQGPKGEKSKTAVNDCPSGQGSRGGATRGVLKEVPINTASRKEGSESATPTSNPTNQGSGKVKTSKAKGAKKSLPDSASQPGKGKKDSSAAAAAGKKGAKQVKTMKFPPPPSQPNTRVGGGGGGTANGSQADAPIEDRSQSSSDGESRKGRQLVASTSFSSTSSFASTSSAYSKKPDNIGEAKVCLDVTSAKFTPDDQKRVKIVLRKILGDPDGIPDFSRSSELPRGEEIIHNFPTVTSEEVTGVPLHAAPGASESTDSRQFMSIIDFASPPEFQAAKYFTVAKKEFLPFLIVGKPIDAIPGTYWEFPTVEFAQDFINHTLCLMYKGDNPQAAAYERTGKWGLISVVYLSSGNKKHLEDYRRFLAEQPFGGLMLDTYPKDVITTRSSISILLRGSMKAWDTEVVPKVLFSRNRNELAGAIRIASTQYFAPQEVSHKGELKHDWRILTLQADDQFLRCLRAHPESRPFSLGVDAVQIRGGLRPPEPVVQLQGKRQWTPATRFQHNTPPQLPLQPFFFNPESTSQQRGRGAAKRGRSGGRRGRARGRGGRT